MDDRRQLREMTDSAFERDIEALLRVDPPPGFVAGVRMRVAHERATEWGSVARVAIGTACVAAALAAVIVVNQWRGDAVPQPSVQRAPSVQLPVKPEQTAPASALQLSSSRSTAAPRKQEPSIQVAAAADVMISPEEAEALKELFVRFSQRRIDMVPSIEVDSRAAPVATITIAPIVVEPLSSGSE